MSEVLKLEYNAAGPSIVVTVDEVRVLPDGTQQVVVGGAGHPPVHLKLSELAALDAKLLEDFSSVLARLEPVARAHGEATLESPAKLVEAAAEIAKAKQDLENQRLAMALEKNAHELEMIAKRAELEGLSADTKSTA